MDHHITRRQFLRYAGVGSAALLFGLPGGKAAAHAYVGSRPDLWLELTAAPRRVALRSGPTTRVWSYAAHVLHGDPASVTTWSGGYLGPILHVHRGQRVRIDFVNRIDHATIVNWHGLHVPADMLGLPRDAVGSWQRYRYEFEVRNRASTCWYHAMAAGHTPEQVYFGLAGLLVVDDEDERALPLPRGPYDVPLVIQDRTWGQGNQFRYLPGSGPGASHDTQASATPPGMHGMMGDHGMMSGGMRDMMTRIMGFFGDSVLVNGHPDASLSVATHAYRLRVLNASNARTYKLAWQDGRPLIVIGTGGGLLARPLHKNYVMLTPGQRIELWADFSKDAVGTRLTLMSLAFHGSMGMMGGGMSGRMGHMMDDSAVPDGAPMPLVKVVVTRKVNEALPLPQRLSTSARLPVDAAVNRNNPRTFHVTMEHMRWGFNGRSFQMDTVAPDEIVQLGTTEIWEFVNSAMMAHAIHLHGLQFQVLERARRSADPDVADGYVDQGWRDTFLLMPNERVKIMVPFADFTGTYAYQCHMLEHAADGLMRNYRIVAQPNTPA